MRRMTKWLMGMTAALSLAAAFSSVSYAQDIRNVRLNFSGTQPSAGDTLGDIQVTADSDLYMVRTAGYQNDESYWGKGDTPRVVIELWASSTDNKFTCSGSSHFSLHGMGASYKSAKILDDGNSMEIVVRLNRVAGNRDIDVVDNLWWDGRTARWDDVDGAERYEVQLYRGDHKVTSERTSSRHYSFSSNMDHSGSYYFRVRGLDGSDQGEWSDWSDDYDVDRSNRDDHSSGHSSSCSDYTPNSHTAGWKQDGRGWWYVKPDGSYPRNSWEMISGKWYFFASNGYMSTGWVQWKGVYYYLGADGAMYVNTTTPDGFYVDANGVWQQGAGQSGAQASAQAPAPAESPNRPSGNSSGGSGGPGVSSGSSSGGSRVIVAGPQH
ncbi:MAG: hypothetical protein PHV18_01575 [Lachnospiraceae bacterium]|nr:hypothetical protein [Lachnospiraceae bacterium]